MCPALVAIRLKKRRPRAYMVLVPIKMASLAVCVYSGVKVIGGSDKEKEEHEEEDFDDAGV